MRQAAWGLFWIAVYLTLVLTPLLVLLLGETPAGGGFWWDFAIALGFAGVAMMGIQFLLTARFRRATAPYGIDIIYCFHRYFAYGALLMVLAHPAILIADNPELVYILNPLNAPWHMTAGVLSAAALLSVAVSSAWRKKFGLPYDQWRISHLLLAAAAMVLALLHMKSIGYYTGPRWNRALWDIVILSWVAVVVYVRIIKPWRLLKSPYRVDKVTPERGNCWTLTLKPEGHGGIAFQPGQFVWLTLRHSPFAMKEHPFSISSSPTPSGSLEVTIKELGDFSRTIGNIAPGESAYVDGPFGAFTMDRYNAPGCFFVAGGIGMAPIMSMLRTLSDRRDTRLHILIAAHSSWERATFCESVLELTKRLNLNVIYVLDHPTEGWRGEKGHITRELLARYLPDERHSYEYFACGPAPMTDAVEKGLYELGVPMSKFHTELFDLV